MMLLLMLLVAADGARGVVVAGIYMILVMLKIYCHTPDSPSHRQAAAEQCYLSDTYCLSDFLSLCSPQWLGVELNRMSNKHKCLPTPPVEYKQVLFWINLNKNQCYMRQVRQGIPHNQNSSNFHSFYHSDAHCWPLLEKH